ncbi:MAG: EamA family transporter [Anaeromyxobacteraceae bacterium]
MVVTQGRAPATPRAALVFAFAVLYLVWGSTFLGIKVAVETIPPFAMPAIRFLVSGLVLLAVRWRALAAVTARQWRNAFVLGGLFFLGNHAMVCTAAPYLPSGLGSIIIATEVPVIAVLSSLLLPGHPLTKKTLAGGALGLAGVAVLFLGTGGADGHAPVGPSLLFLGASISWSIGVVISQRLDQPADPMLRAGLQMAAGGLLLAAGSVLRGEPAALLQHGASHRSLWALAYLVTFGSILAFGCFTWLLTKVKPAQVATHVFVNPLVAVALGVWLAGERLLPVHFLAGAFILASVMVINGTFSRPSTSARLRRAYAQDERPEG